METKDYYYGGLGVAILGGIGFIATDIADHYHALNAYEQHDAAILSLGFLCTGLVTSGLACCIGLYHEQKSNYLSPKKHSAESPLEKKVKE